MITITRRYWGIRVENLYFPLHEDDLLGKKADLIGITQAVLPITGLHPLETLQLDLTKSPEELLMEMKKSTRQQIRQASQNNQLVHLVISYPSKDDIYEFRNFYNRFAAAKQTYRCSYFNQKTLQLMSVKNNLLITRIDGANQKPLCYRVYAYDGIRATPLYSASHYRLTDDPNQKRLLSMAHRYLKWKNMLWLKGQGCRIYDNGGLTDDENIRKFKMEFGGQIVTEYSGYIANSFIAKIMLVLRRMLRENGGR